MWPSVFGRETAPGYCTYNIRICARYTSLKHFLMEYTHTMIVQIGKHAVSLRQGATGRSLSTTLFTPLVLDESLLVRLFENTIARPSARISTGSISLTLTPRRFGYCTANQVSKNSRSEKIALTSEDDSNYAIMCLYVEKK